MDAELQQVIHSRDATGVYESLDTDTLLWYAMLGIIFKLKL